MAPARSRKLTNPSTAEENVVETATVETPEVIEETVTEEVVTPEVIEEKPRIPDALSSQFILKDFCERYLEVLDEIATYNKTIVAERDSEWNPAKVLVKARELASPENAAEQNEEIKKALDVWESLVAEAQKAKRDVINVTSNALGISLSSVAAERDPETEAKLKERRKLAITIGDQLAQMSSLTNDASTKEAVKEFLTASPMPAIGRDQVRTFGTDGSTGSTPKYRVTVVVKRNDETLISEEGFTKTALALPKYYERGKSLKPQKLREVWESAGNTAENTVQPTVEFEDNGLHFIITKR